MKHTKTLTALPLGTVICFLVFRHLRSIQLGLEDPYNNPYTAWSTAFLIASIIDWIAIPIVAIILRSTAGSKALLFAWIVFIFGSYFMWNLTLGLLRTIYG